VNDQNDRLVAWVRYWQWYLICHAMSPGQKFMLCGV